MELKPWFKWSSVPIYFDHDYNHKTFSFVEAEEKFSSETRVFFIQLTLPYMYAGEV